MIPGYQQGADITLLDAKYIRQRKDEATGKWLDDKMILLYKDNVTGEKKRHIIKNPTYIFYIANDDVVIDENLFFIEEENVSAVAVPYTKLLLEIAKETANKNHDARKNTRVIQDELKKICTSSNN